jgi:hypothetical protein
MAPGTGAFLLLFTEREIVSRRWTNDSGAAMSLLDFKTYYASTHDAIALAEYGENAASNITIIDIYCRHPAPAPVNALFSPLCHDNRDGCVKDVSVVNSDNGILITITRQIQSRKTRENIANVYSYQYSRDGNLSESMLDIYGIPTQ